MRKFLSTIGYLWLTIVMVVVGILGVIGFDSPGAFVEIGDTLTVNGVLMVVLMVVGFGGAISTAILTIANFFKQKIKTV